MNSYAESGFAIIIQDTALQIVHDINASEYAVADEDSVVLVSPFPQTISLSISVVPADSSLQPCASVPNSYTLSVSEVLQPSSTSCWAACVVCVGKYHKPGTAYTVFDVEATVGLEDQYATMSQTKNALYRVYGYSSSSVKSSLTANQAMEHIYSGYPILAACAYGASIGHAVVIRGYSSSSTGMSLHLMDPAVGKITVSVISGSTLSYSYSGATFTVSSYIY